MELNEEDQLLFQDWDFNNEMSETNGFIWDPDVAFPDEREEPTPTRLFPFATSQSTSNYYLSTEPPRAYGSGAGASVAIPGASVNQSTSPKGSLDPQMKKNQERKGRPTTIHTGAFTKIT